jgi:NADPH:quinone reductase and related Zn-dependent oxidoreductases
MGGITSEINLGHLMMRRQKIIGSTIRARHKELKGQVMKDLESKVWPLIEKNEIKPVIFKTMNISKIEDAHKLMLNNQNIGKIVIEIT